MAAPRIVSLTVTRLDIPLRQPITMAFGAVSVQNVLLVRMRDSDGVEGIGEASVLGGPHWGVECAEGVQAAIELYIGPALIGQPIDSLEALAHRLARAVRGNPAARSAVEMAGLDLIGRRLGVSAVQLLGGACRTRLPVAWTLSTGTTQNDIAEGERALGECGHTRFKLKFGRTDAEADVRRTIAILKAFEGRASVIADANQGWDEVIAARHLPALQAAGLEAIEQPLPAADLAGAARLRAGLGLEIIADEALDGSDAAFRIAAAGAASVLSLKPNRDGGPTATRRVAAVAAAAGLGLYGGTMLETSIGTAACAHLFAAAPELRLGCELFGPARLTEDLVTEPLVISKGALTPPSGPGLGVQIDEDRVAFLLRRQSAASSLESAA